MKFTVSIPFGSLGTNSIYFSDLQHLIKELGLLLVQKSICFRSIQKGTPNLESKWTVTQLPMHFSLRWVWFFICIIYVINAIDTINMVSFIIQVHQRLIGPMNSYNGSTNPKLNWCNSNGRVPRHMRCLCVDHYHDRLLNESLQALSFAKMEIWTKPEFNITIEFVRIKPLSVIEHEKSSCGTWKATNHSDTYA